MYGSSNTAQTDQYYNSYEYGTGTWAEGSYHSGSMISGTQQVNKNIWCG
jgi:hypothetical protein